MTFDRFLDKLRQWGRPWVEGREPVEIHRALLDDIEAQVVAVGGGRRVFPFDRVEVRLLAATPQEATRLEAIVESGWELEREARERLKARGIRVLDGLAITLQVTQERGPEFGERHYAVAFRKAGSAAGSPAGAPEPAAEPPRGERPKNQAPPADGNQGTAGARAEVDEAQPGEGAGTQAEPEAEPPRGGGAGAQAEPGTAEAPGAAAIAGAAGPAVKTGQVRTDGIAASPGPRAAAGPPGAGRPILRLAVLKGKAVRDSYDFTVERIYLGRLEEVVDASGRVKRRNDVAFLEEGDLSQTVSREHARIAWDAESNSYWLRDEGSASGTMLFRAGRAIEVSRHDRRGVRLENGDEIYLGRAAVKVQV